MNKSKSPHDQNHIVPVIDRMMDILGYLQQSEHGASIRRLATDLGQSRSTVYRIMNTLQRHEMVRRNDKGIYLMGSRILELASQVSVKSIRSELVSVGQPILEQLAAELGESVKLSIVDSKGLLVLAIAQGRREYALTVLRDQLIPLHVGASGKLLIAHMEIEEQKCILARTLVRITEKTIIDPKKLEQEFSMIRFNGWAQDAGENALSINAIAAPISNADGKIVAALSVPFLAGTSAKRFAFIQTKVIKSALEFSALMS